MTIHDSSFLLSCYILLHFAESQSCHTLLQEGLSRDCIIPVSMPDNVHLVAVTPLLRQAMLLPFCFHCMSMNAGRSVPSICINGSQALCMECTWLQTELNGQTPDLEFGTLTDSAAMGEVLYSRKRRRTVDVGQGDGCAGPAGDAVTCDKSSLSQKTLADSPTSTEHFNIALSCNLCIQVCIEVPYSLLCFVRSCQKLSVYLHGLRKVSVHLQQGS